MAILSDRGIELITHERMGSGLRNRLLRVHGAARKLVLSDVRSVFTSSQGVKVASSRPAAVSATGVEGGTRGRSDSFVVKVLRDAETDESWLARLARLADVEGIERVEFLSRGASQ